MVLQISIAVIAVSFVVLAIFAIRTLIALRRVLDSVAQAVNELKGKVETTVEETEHTLRETRLLVEEIRDKSRQAEAVFHSLNGVGKSLEEVTSSISRSALSNRERLGNLVALVGAGMDLVKKWRSDQKAQRV